MNRFFRLPYLPLKWPALRKKYAFEIQQSHYSDLSISIPLGQGLTAPINEKRYLVSFQETFISGEYSECFSHLPLPNRWIDIGCHAGFFSLFTILQRHEAGMKQNPEVLLIDGDKRTISQVALLQRVNQLDRVLKYKCAAIAAAKGKVAFKPGPYMDSKIISDGSSCEQLDVISQNEILALMPGPYDLVKVDIEGAEFEFFTAYKEVVKESKALIVEWHGWHSGGGGKQQIVDLVRSLGFRVVFDRDDPAGPPGSLGLLCCIADQH